MVIASIQIKDKEKELLNFMIVDNIKMTGLMIKCMDMNNLHDLIVKATKASISMIKNMKRERFNYGEGSIY